MRKYTLYPSGLQNLWLCSVNKKLQVSKQSDVHTFLLVLWADFHTAQTVVCEETFLVHRLNFFPRQVSRIVCFAESNKVLGFSVWNWRGKFKFRVHFQYVETNLRCITLMHQSALDQCQHHTVTHLIEYTGYWNNVRHRASHCTNLLTVAVFLFNCQVNF